MLEKLKRKLMVWWVWVAEPFICNPIQTIKQCCSKPDVSDDDMQHLTEAERKALK